LRECRSVAILSRASEATSQLALWWTEVRVTTSLVKSTPAAVRVVGSAALEVSASRSRSAPALAMMNEQSETEKFGLAKGAGLARASERCKLTRRPELGVVRPSQVLEELDYALDQPNASRKRRV